MSPKSKSGFTLLEILLVVGIIAVLAGIVIIAINPAKSLAKTRDLQRKIGIAEINKALTQYYIDKGQYPPSLSSTSVKGICVTGNNATSSGIDCTNQVDLSPLVPNYLAAIPTDPTGVGYQIGLNSSSHVMIIANLTETVSPLIAIGTTTYPIVADTNPNITIGDGSAGNPYQVDNWSQLNHIQDDLSANYSLTASLSASTFGYIGTGDNFQPIGSESSPFTGNFNGNGNTISGLTINLPSTNYTGLFGYSSGNISNIGLTNVNVTGNIDVGGLVGMARGTGIISNSYTTGNVTSSSEYGVGGLVGQTFDQATINNSHSTATVISASGDAGGLVGMESSGTISSSYATGNVTSSSGYDVGGLVGYAAAAFNPASIVNSYSTGNVSGGSTVGVGGLVGTSNPSVVITNSYSTGNVTGVSTIGGLIGRSFPQPTITSSYWDTQTSGQSSSAGGTGTTTAGMKTASTYSGWSGSIWNLVNGSYPTLK